MKVLRKLPSRRGAAILTVLFLVMLASVLVVSILQSGISEKRLSKGSFESRSAERYAENALQVVLAQLRTATTRISDEGVPSPWSSQPGAVTVYGADGSVEAIHKLYSAAELTAGGETDLEADLPVNWDDIPGQYVDLNQPTPRPGGGWIFPVADPRMAGPDGAEGFGIEMEDAPRGTVADTHPDADHRRLPMPVRWIYLLQDGTAGVLDGNGIFQSPTGRATEKNPVTARIAWWADDETAKINVNTAGEAAPWDTPRLTTFQDRALAEYQPMKGEYHRYPGHPAGVSLSSVLFPRHRWLQPGDWLPQGEFSMEPDIASSLWELAAGTATDPALTSLGGTRRPPGLELPQGNGVFGQWHLYASPQEIAFDQDRKIRSLFTGETGAARRLGQSGFLLTAVSQAPETTLFGTPRVSLWPVHESVHPGIGFSSPVERASAMDSMLALCATAGPRRYYVQRATPGDGSAEFQRTGLGANAQLFQWLCGLLERPVPGFHRNTGALTFAEKYGPGPDGDSRNLVALMLDYIRTTNLADGSIARQNQYSIVCPGNETEGYGQISPLETARGTSGQARWRTEQLGAARGLGRMPTIHGAVLVLICRAICDENGQVQGQPSSAEARQALNKPGMREMEAAILFEGFIPGQGWAESRPYCSLVAAGRVPGAPADFSRALPFMQVNGSPLLPVPKAKLTRLTEVVTRRNSMPKDWTASGGSAAALIANTLIFAPFIVSSAGNPDGFLQFEGSFGGNGGPPGIKVGIFDSPGITAATVPSALGDLIQVVEMNFPGIPLRGLRLPSLPQDLPAGGFEDRLLAVFEKGGSLLSAQDVAQSLVTVHGDSRLIAGKRVVAPDEFVAHPEYGRQALAHRLQGEPGGGTASAGPRPGYFPDLNLPASGAPDFTVQPWDNQTPVLQTGIRERQVRMLSMAAAFSAGRLDQGRRGPASPAETGDFDTASGRVKDGPYINRADDGELRGFAGNGVPYFDTPPSDPKTVPAVSAAASSPNRLVPGPGMFGSLPTGVKANVPWQTLLFRPWLSPVTPQQPAHYGATGPPDHLLLDLFWMPVVEPYGLSTPMETAGKINLNQQPVPFRHIRRNTALHALLKSERIIAIRDADAADVKKPQGFSHALTRLPIDAETTLDAWNVQRRQLGRPWISASEICTLPLYPASPDHPGSTPAQLAAWWNRHRLTGDNLKERPYTNLHARLTTRSNTFRVHIIAQTLQKSRATSPAKWEENKDQVLATWRGSALISRHIRAEDLPDYASAGNAPPVDHFYRWRISSHQRLRVP